MVTPVAVYVRISRDTLGQGFGVARQEQDCRALAELRGWTVTRVFTDNDVSAYSGKPRPQYRALLAAIAAREVVGVIAWHPDRLHRSPKELEAFIDLIQATGCRVDTVQTGHVDLSTAAGQLNARVIGAFARFESEHRAARIGRKLQQNAQAGSNGRGPRPYGWERDKTTLRPVEAAEVRYAVDRVLSGVALRTISSELTKRGATNTAGLPWSPSALRAVVLSPRNAGQRVYRGDVLDGVVGKWEPIVSSEELATVTFLLTDPGRRSLLRPAGRALLSGIATCGVCGATLHAGQRNRGDVTVLVYRCGQCRRVARDAARLDAHVLALVFELLSEKDAASLVVPPEGAEHVKARASAARLRRKLLVLAQDFGDGVLTRAERDTSAGKIRRRLATLDAQVTRTGPTVGALPDLLCSQDLAVTWAGLDGLQQRSAVAALVTVVVHPTRRGAQFLPADVSVTPHQAGGAATTAGGARRRAARRAGTLR